MSLEFLSADLVRPHDGSSPVFRSPISPLLHDAGATFVERAGWEVAASVGSPAAEQAACRQAVGVADQSWRGKIELQSAPESVAAIAARLAGGPLHLTRASNHDDVWWCLLSPTRALAVTYPERTPEVRARLEEAAADSDVAASVADVTTSLCSNAVVGPLARETFARVSALDLRERELGPGGLAAGSVARVPGIVLRERADTYLHLFGAAHAEYIWTVFLDAAESLGGRAVGIDALAAGGPGEARG
jgi:aminomethyltransferase